ncbi:MAG: Rpn family recombination-promoting nuclease/putative transposase [Muribaculaceae bacterium]|nr:Rpn family recombination-promoting nuclease/putative transposase [Muribaculaceae bacterium]
MAEKKSIYINPLTDFGFKRLFGSEDNKKYLISFLNALFRGEEKIVDVTYVDKEGIPDYRADRALIYDIHCMTADNRKLIVEMQNRYQAHFDDRAIYYIATDLVKQAVKGKEWDYSLIPVYGIFMMNFDWKDMGKNYKDFLENSLIEPIALVNLRTGRIFSNKIKMYFLKLPLMDKKPEECEDLLDIWIYLFKNLENMNAIPQTFTERYDIFKDFGKSARVAALSKEERVAYEASLKAYRDNYAIATTERQLGFAEGEAKGRAEGEAKGRAEGEAKGMEKGTHQMLQQNVHSMRANGLDNPTIARFLNQPLDLIESL